MKYVSCLITVDDIERSKAFYQGVMRQKVKYDFGKDVFFEGGFSIHLRTHFAELIGQRQIIGENNSFELYFEFDDVDKFAKVAKEKGATLIHDVVEQPWKQRVIRFYDPDKNIVEVGEPMESLVRRLSKEGRTIEEIGRITGLSVTFVRESLKGRK